MGRSALVLRVGLGGAVAAQALRRLLPRGDRVVPIEREERHIFADGASADFNLLLYVPPHRAPAVMCDAGFTNECGWVPVDRYMRVTKYPRVYAVGDITVIPLKMSGPLPGAGLPAQLQPSRSAWCAGSFRQAASG